jgi:hypothetical protein
MADYVNFDFGSPLVTLTSQANGNATTANQTNPLHHGLMVWINVSAAGGGTLTVVIQGVDPATGNVVTLLSSSAVGAGETFLQVLPSLANVANSTASLSLPPTWNLKWTVAGSTGLTATITCSKLV